MNLSDEISEYKKEHSIPILNRNREEEILKKVSVGKYAPYIRLFFETILTLSRIRQDEFIHSNRNVQVELNSRCAEMRNMNIVLIGMPGCGKTTVGKALAQLTGRKAVDFDEEIESEAGISIAQIFAKKGESTFREMESFITLKASYMAGAILITGGGIVKNIRNYAPLKCNGRIYHLLRDTSLLKREGRPLSQGADLVAMEYARRPLYELFRDVTIDNNGTIESSAAKIWEEFQNHVSQNQCK